jgi:hypothetical protein
MFFNSVDVENFVSGSCRFAEDNGLIDALADQGQHWQSQAHNEAYKHPRVTL